MVFPISIYSKDDWLSLVPPFLISLAFDSEIVEDESFHRYLASTLEKYFNEDSFRFIEAIKEVLQRGTDEGRFVLLESLNYAKSLWRPLADRENIQPILTELALSTDRIYAKSAVTLSKKLEEVRFFAASRLKSDVPQEEEMEALALDDESPRDTRAREILSEPSPAPPGAAPSSTTRLPPSPAAVKPPPAPMPFKETEERMEKREAQAKPEKKKRKAALEKEKMMDTLEEVGKPADIEAISENTIHTHVHYYSRMNPRKTYPFTVTLSTIAKTVAQDRVHFLSGEEEKETRGEFQITDTSKQLIVEPLISGCLVQPTFQWVDPRSKNLPKELTFFITPLVEAGFRATPLRGELLIKDDLSNEILKLKLHDMSVVSNRVSQVLALVGTIGGGTMPALDFMFGIDLQMLLVQQLQEQLPALVSNIDLGLLLTGFQISLFAGAIGLGLIWWWRKGRAKLAPERSTQWEIPNQ